MAQALRVNYNGLKHHVQASQAPHHPEAGSATASFVEVPVRVWPAAENTHEWVIELEDRGGSKLRLWMPPGASAAALTLAQELWSART